MATAAVTPAATFGEIDRATLCLSTSPPVFAAFGDFGVVVPGFVLFGLFAGPGIHLGCSGR